MTYYNYLKKRFPFYIISSVILCVALFSLITIHNYNAYLIQTLSDLNSVRTGKSNVRKQIDEIITAKSYLKRTFNIDVTNVDPDTYVFNTLDEIKSKLRNAVITVSGFETAGGKKKLPVSVVAHVNSYKMILQHLKYLESFRIPDFSIKDIKISQEAEKVVLNVQGFIIMPSLGSANMEGSYG